MEKKKRGGQPKAETEKSSPFPLRLPQDRIEWIKANVAKGGWSTFILEAVDNEIARMKATMKKE